MQQQSNSEVARIMAQISAENEAAQRGIAGISEGGARHSFIKEHMERVWAYKDALAVQVGDEGQATTMICEVLLSEQ